MWKHKECGGEMIYAYLKKYEPLYKEPKRMFPDYFCRKCGKFISGDINEFATWEEKDNDQI
jgi:hypothetical protein